MSIRNSPFGPGFFAQIHLVNGTLSDIRKRAETNGLRKSAVASELSSQLDALLAYGHAYRASRKTVVNAAPAAAADAQACAITANITPVPGGSEERTRIATIIKAIHAVGPRSTLS